MAGAWDLSDRVCADDRVEFLSEPEAIEPQLRRLSALRSPSPKLWADAYLLAFASVAGAKACHIRSRLHARGTEAYVPSGLFNKAKLNKG